ncbi:MAG: right-handed parallel beta-helix repeat-containing protein [Verrucomicrobiaceae bacterium]|nr:right-handed parallel beta-helix repeat-containing protein [Verrucomicrobiaceae bacterium]
MRNFLRQGIQMCGGKGDGGHLVTHCRDLAHTIKPGGTTIHVEHAEGGKGFRIEKNVCRQSLLVGGGAEELIVRDNDVTGRIEGNSIVNGVFENNRLTGQGRKALMQFGYADGLVIRGNTIRASEDAVGIYVWGASRYNPAPSKNIAIERNTPDLPGQPISLNGVEGATVRGNTITGSKARNVVEAKRCESLTVEETAKAAP